MELFFKTVLLGYFILFVLIALLGRTYLIYKKTGINALTQPNQDRHLYLLAIIFKIHLVFELGLVIDYVFNINILTAYPFTFLPTTVTAFAGSFLLVTCLGIIIIAQNQMKSSWRIEIDKEHETDLIETGFFRYSRNPIFLALRLSYFAVFLIVPCPYSLIVFLIGDFAFRSQVRHEEQHLRQNHGDEYVAYCSRVRRWI